MPPITTQRRALALAILITILVSIFLLYRSDEYSNINSIPINQKPAEPLAAEKGNSAPRPPTKKLVDAKNLMSVSHCDTAHFNWVSDDIDGLITKFQDDKLILSHITGKVKLAIDTSSIIWNGTILSFNSHRLVLSQKYLLLENNIVKLSHTEGMVSDYYLYDIHKGKVEKLYDRVSIVVNGSTLLAFVSNFDVYVYRDGEITLLTDHGDSLRRHGIPNWIYREEIFGNNKNIWISKYDSIAWLTFNDANVGTIDIQYYKWSANKYPFTEKMRYPKAGTVNPSVELWVHMNDQTEQVLLPLEDRLLVQVDWLENELLVRTMSRTQDQQELFLVNFDSGINIELLRNESVLDGGWYQHLQPLKVCGKGYVELQDKDGRIQIKYYEGIRKDGVWLTRGDSDVNEILHASKTTIYFSRAENSGVERHIYSIALNGEEEESLITKTLDPNGVLQVQGERLDLDFSSGGYFEAAFSPAGTYFTLSYKGPGVPWKIVKETVSNNVVAVTKSCLSLRRRMLEFDFPTTKYLTIKNDHGDEMNAKMIFPPRFRDTGKYPVLIKVYGGPGTQEAKKVFSIEFMHKLAIHGVIGIMVDGRGTGFKGRAYMLSVLKTLGKFESEDQISAGKWLANQPYVDKKRIALFGWSYGGYVTAKVIEADSGVFSFGIAVAPVTDWNYYDTFYTERYMKTPQQNPAGYQTSAVTNMTGFENSNFLLIHGLSDTNVHFQNSADLIWKLTGAGNTKYSVHVYTDSDHEINTNRAGISVFTRMEDFICNKFELDCL